MFDPNGVQVAGLEGALPLVPHSIDIDTRAVGVPGEVIADVVHDKRSVHCHVEKLDSFHYRLHFTPKDAGKHRVRMVFLYVIFVLIISFFKVYIYFNGYDVKGSPFMMRVGTQKRTKSSSSSPNTNYRASPTNRFTSSSPINNSSHNTSKHSSYNR